MPPSRAVLARSIVSALVLMVPSPLPAQGEPHPAHTGVTVETEDEDWHAHPNHLLGFAGSTFDAEESAFTIGLDYTRQVNQRVSVGAFADYAEGPLREFLAGPMAVVFPWKGLYLEAAPAAAREDGEWYFVGRLGTGYEVELGSLLIGPYAAIDLSSGRTPLYVLGAAAGIHF